MQGFVAGIFQGLAGVATKPTVGCLDAVTHTGEAVRAMAGGLSSGDSALSARRSRFPQPFGPDGRMMPGTAATACGALLLARFPLWKVSQCSSPAGHRFIRLMAGIPRQVQGTGYRKLVIDVPIASIAQQVVFFLSSVSCA